MPIWRHKEVVIPSMLGLGAFRCEFCKWRMIPTSVKDRWSRVPENISKDHEATVLAMAEMDGDFILEESDIVDRQDEEDSTVYCCPLCGWWVVIRVIWISSKHQLWNMYYGVAGALRHLQAVDITEPVSEIRKYLAADYGRRFDLSPQKFEEVVASIFQSLGYRAELTAISNDGGIDIVLQDRGGEITGVQVKRYRNAIKIEQIRSFVGALVIDGMTRGVFVTTSSFQGGAKGVIAKANVRGVKMGLVDAGKLYELLEIAQIANWNGYSEISELASPHQLSKLYFLLDIHMNSL
jgi:restriction system protein